jgi:hypothetical protein
MRRRHSATLNGKGHGHGDISNNGTVANALTGSVGNIIDISAAGMANLAVNVVHNGIDGTGHNVGVDCHSMVNGCRRFLSGNSTGPRTRWDS